MGLVLKDEFCDLRCFLMQLSNDTKISMKTSFNISGNLPPTPPPPVLSVRGAFLVRSHLNPVISFHVITHRKTWVLWGRGPWRTQGQEGRDTSAAIL